MFDSRYRLPSVLLAAPALIDRPIPRQLQVVQAPSSLTKRFPFSKETFTLILQHYLRKIWKMFISINIISIKLLVNLIYDVVLF